MSFDIAGGLRNLLPGPLDVLRGPYDSLAAANGAVPSTVVNGKNFREGKFVEIGTNGVFKTYWWRGTGQYLNSDLEEYVIDPDLSDYPTLDEVYTKDQVYSKGETLPASQLYTKSQVYTKAQVDQAIIGGSPDPQYWGDIFGSKLSVPEYLSEQPLSVITDYKKSGNTYLNVVNPYNGIPTSLNQITTKRGGGAVTDADVDNRFIYKFSDGGYGVIGLINGNIDIESIGAIPDDSNADNSSVITIANRFATQWGCGVSAQGKDYYVKKQTYWTQFHGVEGKTRLIVSSDFTYQETQDGKRYSTFLNPNFGGTFNINADYLSFSGFTIDFRQTNATYDPSVFCFANVKGGLISKVDIIINAGLTGVNATACDLWACCNNIRFEFCRAYVYNESSVGGGFWVRNITNNGALSSNDTQNITYFQCEAYHAAKDEPIAAYGVLGMTRDIYYINCKFEGLPTSQQRSVLASAFPLRAASAGGVNAGVKNINYINCEFKDKYFTSHVFRSGQSGTDQAQICNEITVKGCKFYVSKSVANTSYVARHIQCVGDETYFIGNEIYAIDSPISITYGVSGFKQVAGHNIIKGKFSQGAIFNCPYVDDIVADVSSTVFYNCDSVTNFDATSAGNSPVLYQKSATMKLARGILKPTGTGTVYAVYAQSLSSSNPNVNIDSVDFIMPGASSSILRVEGTGLDTSLQRSRGFGTANSTWWNIPASFTTYGGNTWFGSTDLVKTAAPSGSSFYKSMPRGFQYSLAVSSGQIVGYRKTKVENNDITDWDAIYNESPFNFNADSGLYHLSKAANNSTGGFVRLLEAYGVQYDAVNGLYIVAGTDLKTMFTHDNGKFSFYEFPANITGSFTYSQIQQYAVVSFDRNGGILSRSANGTLYRMRPSDAGDSVIVTPI